jgi:UDP-glucose:(heptosyl)LPS alpha-1,3-glucosyltransferase
MERAFAELIRRASPEIDLIVVSSELQTDLRPLVTWARVPAPRAPAPLRFILFWFLAGTRLLRLRPDAVHTLGAITWARADLVTVQFCHAAFAKIGTRADPGASLVRRCNTRVHGALALWAERFCFREGRVRRFAAVSPGVQRELAKYYQTIPVTLTPNGVDADRFRPDAATRAATRNAQGLDESEVIAVFVGGDWRRKGLDIAIEALAIAAPAVADPLRLWIIGKGDPDPFRALARDLGVEERVSLLGRQSAVETYLQASDIFVFPTSYETFSIASYEAAAAGLPILATPVSGIEDLIGADETGISADATPEAVAAGLVRLACDRALRVRLGDAGRLRAREFSWERSALSVLRAYSVVLNDTQASAFDPAG